MGRRRKVSGPKSMEKAWEEFKHKCNNRAVLCHEFSNKDGKFVSAPLIKSVTYTIEGFCHYLGINKSNFYDTYDKDPKFREVISRIRDECEIDVREKFELGVLNPKLAPLWMSKFGYSTKADQNVNADAELAISVDYGDQK